MKATTQKFKLDIFMAVTSVKKYTYTANLLTAKTTGIHCVTFPTAVSMHFLQLATACSGTL